MTITVRWDTEDKSLVVSEFEGQWTWNDFHAAARQMHDLIGAVDHRVDLLLWHKVEFPLGNPLIHFKNAMKNQPANIGQVVVVAPRLTPATKGFLKALATILERIIPVRSNVALVASIEEARALLANRQQM